VARRASEIHHGKPAGHQIRPDDTPELGGIRTVMPPTTSARTAVASTSAQTDDLIVNKRIPIS
jgi:hypothetical protein